MVYLVEEGAMRALRGFGLILLVMVLALSVTMAAVAEGKGKPPTTATTSTLPPQPTSGGHDCAYWGFTSPAELAAHDFAPTANGFTFTLRGSLDDFCVDIAVDGPWHVTGTASGVSSLSLIPRDSASPGDSCGGASLKRPTAFDLYLPTGITLATVNSCGLQYGEWIGGSLVTTQTGARDPLVFIAQMLGKTGAVATINVEFPEFP
jgi:hypothetical protein